MAPAILWAMLAVTVVDAAPRPGDEYRINWARAELGAKLVVHPNAHPVTGIDNLLATRPDAYRHASGHTIFADKVQRERLVIDLGQERLIGRVFIGSHPQGASRHPDSVTIRSSTAGPDGPWTALTADGDMTRQHTFLFENTPVRFLEIDLGESLDSRGSRITSLGAFTRYRCPEAAEAVKWLAESYDRDAEGLARFFAAADAEDWNDAVRQLRGFYAARLEERPPGVSERSRGIADDMLDHRFRFGEPAHTFGPKVESIDWAFELDYEWTNSLNRCGFWTHASNVYQGTGDARYVEKIEAQLLHWIETCPLPPNPKEGRYYSWQTWDCPARITWRSLDSAIRLWKLCALVPVLCADRDHVSDKACMNLLYSIWEHLNYLSDDDWDGGNWLSTVNSSVLDAAVAFPEFRDSGSWLAFAKAAFETNVMRDVRPDGKEIENSVGYVAFAYGSMFNVLKTLTERGADVNPEVRRRLDLLQDFLAWCLFPDMTAPMIGDADRGGPGLLERTWPFFGRQDIRYIITQGREGTPPEVGSRYWEDSGWAVMRSDWGRGNYADALHLVIKASPVGPHGHLDQLSMTLYAYGRPLIIDPGRCNYRAEGRRFRSTPYHNAVTIDGADQADGNATFERWESAHSYDLAVGSHGLYEGATHRRTVLFVKPRFFLVRDDVEAEGEHECVARWHFPEGADPRKLEDHRVTTQFTEGANVLVVPLGGVAESFAEDFEIAYQWDERLSARGWAYKLARDSLVTLLVPYRGAEIPEVAVDGLSAADGTTDLRVTIDERSWDLSLGGDRPPVSRR